VGKTELSKAVAQWYAERGRVDAALWASASPAEPEDSRLRDLPSLLSLAGRAWDLPLTEQTPLAAQKEMVRGFLEQRSASVLLLDNWETLVETKTARDVWEFVRGLPDTVHVLVTSRNALPSTEARNIELDPLADGDAVSLLVNIAGGTGYFERNPSARTVEGALIYAICERLSGYPLALEVVGGLTVSRSLGDIWGDLQQFPKNVLESVDEITGEPRGVWTSLDLSYDALPDAEKTLFRQMSVFLAPAPFADIAAILTEVPNARPCWTSWFGAPWCGRATTGTCSCPSCATTPKANLTRRVGTCPNYTNALRTTTGSRNAGKCAHSKRARVRVGDPLPIARCL
jgi:predicted ATPase